MPPPSPRKVFLDSLAPKWKPPPCPMGNLHSLSLSMGSKIKEDIGRRSFFCNTKYGGRLGPPCTRDKAETSSPVLPNEERIALRAALDAFDRSMKAHPGAELASLEGKRAYLNAKTQPQTLIKPSELEVEENVLGITEDHDSSKARQVAARLSTLTTRGTSGTITANGVERQIRTRFSDSAPIEDTTGSVNADMNVKVFIFIKKKDPDRFLEFQGMLSDRNTGYSFISDNALCALIDFPTRDWSFYDRGRDQFVPIPTFASLTIVEREFLIIRPSSFQDADCNGLRNLVQSLRSHEFDKPSLVPSASRKRNRHTVEQTNTEEQPARKKRRVQSSSSQVFDWTNL